MRYLLLAAVLVSLPATAVAQSDPWRIRKVVGAELMVTITLSKKSYAIVLRNYVPDHAAGPREVALGLKKSEQRSLARCREKIEARKFDTAAKLLRNMLRRDPGNHDARLLEGLMLHRQGRHEEALLALRESIIGNRRKAEAWKLLGEVAAALGKTVVRPKLDPRGWTIPKNKEGDIEISHSDSTSKADYGWFSYAVARAYFRHEGPFAREFPKAKEYRFSIRELVFATSAAVTWAGRSLRSKEPCADDLARLAREHENKRVIPFVFFAIYPEPIGKVPEPGFETLKPRLEKYFDEHIVIPAGT